MTARRVLLWRHGRTEWNAVGRMQGQLDVGLDELGVLQAAQAAPLVAAEEPDAIVSSDLVRARVTADALAAVTGLTVRLDARLRETCFGPWQGLTHDQISAGWPKEHARWLRGEPAGIEGAETPAQVATRMREAIDDALAVTDGTLVVVSHGGSAKRAVQALLDWSDATLGQLGVLGNCRWTELRHTVRGWRLHGHNLGPISGAVAVQSPSTAADVEPASSEMLTSSPTPR